MSTTDNYLGDGTTTRFNVTATQYSWTSVVVSLAGEEQTTGYTYDEATKQVVFDTAPGVDVRITIRRLTDTTLLYKFGQGAAFTGANIDSNFSQYQTAVEEVQSAADKSYVDDAVALEEQYRQEADASLQSQITGGTPVLGNQISVVSWHAQIVSNSVDVPANMNAFSVGPQLAIAPGQVVNLGENSTWAILGNAYEMDALYNLTANNITTSDGESTVTVPVLAALPARMAAEETKVQPTTLGGTGAITAAGGRNNLGAAAKGANSDITSITGLTTPLATSQGGTGNTTGLAATATALATARTIQTNLGSTTAASFNGTANASPGVTGVLPVANGGTGANTVVGARTAIGAAASAGVTDASSAAAGAVGEVLYATATSVSMTAGVAANVVSLTLTAGDWDLAGAVSTRPTGATITQVIAGTTTTSGASPVFPNRIVDTTSSTGVLEYALPTTRVNVSASTTIYLVVAVGYTSGSATADGYIQARRAR